jgi:hypothetical protein
MAVLLTLQEARRAAIDKISKPVPFPNIHQRYSVKVKNEMGLRKQQPVNSIAPNKVSDNIIITFVTQTE